MSSLLGRVLVVDDVPDNREILVRRLTRAHLDVVKACDGLDALAKMESGSFDLVLLDIMMPGLDGYEVLQRLRADPVLRLLPVIVISAIDELDSVIRCIELGADDYLTKPFNPVLLKARVNACLEKKRLRDQEREYLLEIERERARADELLGVILPQDIIEELKETGQVSPRNRENVAVLFADVVGFTKHCERTSAENVLSSLQRMVRGFEELCLQHELRKTKTIGDCFMATAGLFEDTSNPVLQAVQCGHAMVAAIKKHVPGWQLRVGIHVGPVIAGIVGHRQYLFDVWGDTVNTAQRVEQHGLADGVVVSAEALKFLGSHYQVKPLDAVTAKNKGRLALFQILNKTPRGESENQGQRRNAVRKSRSLRDES